MSTLQPLRLRRLQGKDPFPLDVTPTPDGQRLATPKAGGRRVDLPRPKLAPDLAALNKKSSSRRLVGELAGPRPTDGPLGGYPGRRGSGGPGLRSPVRRRSSVDAPAGDSPAAGSDGRSLLGVGEMNRPRQPAPSPTALLAQDGPSTPEPGLGVQRPTLGALNTRGAKAPAGRTVLAGGTGLGQVGLMPKDGPRRASLGALPARLKPDDDGSGESAGSRGSGRSGEKKRGRSKTKGRSAPVSLASSPHHADLVATGHRGVAAALRRVGVGGAGNGSQAKGPGGGRLGEGLFDDTDDVSGGAPEIERMRAQAGARPGGVDGPPAAFNGGAASPSTRRRSAPSSPDGRRSKADSVDSLRAASSKKERRKSLTFDRSAAVLCEGHLLKLRTMDGVVDPSKMWQKRYFQLRAGYLMFFHSKRKVSEPPSGWGHVDNITAVRLAKHHQKLPGTDAFSIKCCFTVSMDDGRVLRLRAHSQKEAKHWMKALNVARGLMDESALKKGKKKKKSRRSSGAKSGTKDSRGAASGAEEDDDGEDSGGAEGDGGGDGDGDAPSATGRGARLREMALQSAKEGSERSSGTPEGDDELGEWKETYDELTESKHFINIKTAESARDAPPASEEGDDGAEGEGEWIKAWDFNAKCAYYYHTVKAISTYEKPDDFVEDEATAGVPPSGWGWGASNLDDAKSPKLPSPDRAAAAKARKLQEEEEEVGEPSTPSQAAARSGFGSGKVPDTDDGGDDASGKAEASKEAAQAAAGDDANAAGGAGGDGEPVHWIECWDNTYNCPYYVNTYSDESSWERPTGNVVITQYGYDVEETGVEDEVEPGTDDAPEVADEVDEAIES